MIISFCGHSTFREEPEVKEEEPEVEEKEEEKDKEVEQEEENKEEEESNKDDRDAIIKELQDSMKALKAELERLKEQHEKMKKMKESVEMELAKYKVQEKVNIARKIKDLKESIGIECEEAEKIAENNTINELNLIYTTLKETCSYTQLPNKILMESVVNEEADNIKEHIELKESVDSDVEEEYQDLIQLQNLHKRLFK